MTRTSNYKMRKIQKTVTIDLARRKYQTFLPTHVILEIQSPSYNLECFLLHSIMQLS